MIKTILQAFGKSVAITAGIIFGIFFAFLPIAMLKQSSEKTPATKYSLQVVSGPDGMRKALDSTSPLILQLDIKGMIGLKDLTRQKVERMLIESQEKNLKGRIKGLFLSIDTPGGTVHDADGIYHAIKSYKEKYKIPVFAHVDGLCASGGMYVACAADKITASDISLVGSVGVIVPTFVNVYKLLNFLGISSKTFAAGMYKDELNPTKRWKEDEGEGLRKIVDNYYDKFIGIVSQNRPRLTKEDLRSKLGAQVFPAERAAVLGYIDQAGISREEALSALAKEAKQEETLINYVTFSDDSFLDKLMESRLQQKPKNLIDLQLSPFPSELQGKILYLWTATP